MIKILKENSIIIQLLNLLSYAIIFVYCVTKDPIVSYDTLSYLRADPERNGGYVIFIKAFKFIFFSQYELFIVIFQTIFSLFCVHIFWLKAKTFFRLKGLVQFIFLAILLIPFFEPLLISVNLVSEGISYGLYLLLVALGLVFLCEEHKLGLFYFGIFYLLLVFVRGQFLFVPLVFAFVYGLKNKRYILQKRHFITLVIFVLLPIASVLLDKTYHKLKDGFFKSSPYAFVNSSASAFYVADKEDVSLFSKTDEREIFLRSYNLLEQKKLLQKSLKNHEDTYLFFHKNLPRICNQTIHKTGREYFYEKYKISSSKDLKYTIAKASFSTEAVVQNITLTLIKDNFSKWLRLFYNNISHGFYSSLFLFFSVAIMIFSFIKFITSYNKIYGLIFLFSTLILSNALITAFFSHSIQRYLLYNYGLYFLIFVMLINLIKYEFKS